jgi:hypothetical protein
VVGNACAGRIKTVGRAASYTVFGGNVRPAPNELRPNFHPEYVGSSGICTVRSQSSLKT